MKHEVQTTHTYSTDDEKAIILIDLNFGTVESILIRFEDDGMGKVKVSVIELIELAALFGQAAAFLAELGIKEEDSDPERRNPSADHGAQ